MSLNETSHFIEKVRVIDPASGRDGIFDVWVQDGKIKAIELPGIIQSQSNPELKSVSKINGEGKWLCPGLIDVHVHLREPGHEYKETIQTGVNAAARGGFSSVACMANTSPVNDSPVVTQYILDRACMAKKSRVFPIGAVTKGLQGKELAEIGLMVQAGAKAISDDGMPVMNSFLMRKAMEYAKTFDIPIISHAEDLNLSQAGGPVGAPMNEGAWSALMGHRGNPKASEEIMVAREIALARLTGARLHLAHLSTSESVKQLKRAKEDGVKVTGEVTPHHLTLTDAHICSHGSYYGNSDFKMAPPLRTQSDIDALLNGLNSGEIEIIASDHAPHGCVDKQTEFELAANGIVGLESTLAIVLELVNQGRLNLMRAIDALTYQPAKMLGLHHLGKIQIGLPADLVLIDPAHNWELKKSEIISLSQNTPFDSRKFKGRAVMTIVDGYVVSRL